MKKDKSLKDLRKNNNLDNKKGITLIALVITIIILLILAGVTIQTLTSDNGLLQKAQTATEVNDETKKLELIKLAVASAQVAGEGTLNTDNLNNELKNNFNDEKTINVKENYWTYKGYKINNDGSIEKWLPEEYQEVEYIESTGTQYLNTNVLARNNIQIETKIEVTNIIQDTTVFGYYNEYTSFHSNGNYYHLTPFNNKWYFGQNGKEGNASIYKAEIGMKYDIIFNDTNGAIIINDEVLYANGIYETPDDSKIAISKRGSKSNFRNGKFKYFYFRIFDKNENKYIRKFIPCYSNTTVIDMDGKQCPKDTIGLYDTVEGKFYTNQGTGEFIAGPEV